MMCIAAYQAYTAAAALQQPAKNSSNDVQCTNTPVGTAVAVGDVRYVCSCVRTRVVAASCYVLVATRCNVV